MVVRNSINPPMLFVAQGRFISGPAARAEAARRRIVLDDVVVPIHHPERPVRADFAVNGRAPFVIAGRKVASIMRDEIRAVSFEIKLAKQMASRFGDKLDAIPILLRKLPSGVNAAAGPGSVTAMEI